MKTLIAAATAVLAMDGDDIVVGGWDVRLLGVDAPALAQTCTAKSGRTFHCGISAAQHLRRLIRGRTVRCGIVTCGSYGRPVGHCYAVADVFRGRKRPGFNINAAMVRSGWAVAYRKYSHRYTGAEALARRGKRGLWNTRFEMPWAWRWAHYKRRRERKAQCRATF